MYIEKETKSTKAFSKNKVGIFLGRPITNGRISRTESEKNDQPMRMSRAETTEYLSCSNRDVENDGSFRREPNIDGVPNEWIDRM